MKIIIAVILAILAFLLLVVGGWAMLGPKANTSTKVRLYTAQRGNIVELVSAPGTVEPKTKVSISARIMARIVELPFKEGETVTRGDPDADPPVPPSLLLRLDATDLQAGLLSTKARREAQAVMIKRAETQLAVQQAQIESILAPLADKVRTLKRQLDLLETADVSQQAVEQAQSLVDELKARLDAASQTLAADKLNIQALRHQLEAADADITRAEDQLLYTTITSPINGVVTRLNAEVGELVVTGTMNNAGTVILEVADLSVMLFMAQVDEAGIGLVQAGQKANIRLRAFRDRIFHGVVDQIALIQDMAPDGTKYYETKILIDTEGERIISGLSGDVEIETLRHDDVLKVPSQAVLGRSVEQLPVEIRENNVNVDTNKALANVVYRYIDGKAVATPVTIGASDTTHTIIVSGISESDQLIVGPFSVLENLKHDQVLQDEGGSSKSTPPAKTSPTKSADQADDTPPQS